jgi:hypothetical protein
MQIPLNPLNDIVATTDDSPKKAAAGPARVRLQREAGAEVDDTGCPVDQMTRRSS